MDTKNDSSISDVPTFKVARVGNDRKRKGGGWSFLRGSGARGVWSGASGGAGAGVGIAGGAGAIGAGFGLSNFAIILAVSLIGLGLAGLGRMLGNASSSDVKKPKAFSMASKDPVQLEGDTSNLPSTGNTIPNSMGYISGSMDGLTPEERAKKAADAAAAAEAQRIADEEAAKKAEKDRLAGNPAVDPNALLASAKADGGPNAKGGSLGKKFGALSSSMGSGSSLSGGAGMSGGMNRQFASSGGITKGASGQLSAMKGGAHPSSSRASNAKLAMGNTKGFARKQLVGANLSSRKGAAAGRSETSAADAGSAFDNNAAAGTAISGPGVGKGGGPQSDAGGGANPGNGSPTGGGDGGTGCGKDKYQAADGTCKEFQTNGGTDAKPMLTMMANAVMAMLLIIGVVAAVAIVLEKTAYGTAIAQGLKGIVGMMGVMIGLMGLAMAAMGDYVSGGVATLVGAYIGYMCFGATHMLTAGQAMVAGLGGAAAMMVGKMIDKGNHKDKAPVAAQQ